MCIRRHDLLLLNFVMSFVGWFVVSLLWLVIPVAHQEPPIGLDQSYRVVGSKRGSLE